MPTSSENRYRLTLSKAWKHFRTITAHRLLVRRYCFRCGLIWQGLTHDLSKYSPAEFLVGARYFQGDRSPNDAERKQGGASRAWMHHKGRTRHHYEYWTDYQFVPGSLPMIGPVPMPDKYILEMFCDRVAASRIYNKEAFTSDMPLAYLIRCGNERFMAPDTVRKLRRLLELYRDKGDEAFKEARAVLEAMSHEV